MARKWKCEECEKVEVYRWNGWRYVLAKTMTPEEAKAEELAAQEKSKQTNARRRRLKKIVWENKFESLEDALGYLLDGGEATAEFLEYMDKDESTWKWEIKCARDGWGSKKGWKEQLNDQNHEESDGRVNSTPPEEQRQDVLAEMKKIQARHVAAFRGRLENRGYTQVHIKQTKPGIYLVQAVEPLAGVAVQTELRAEEMDEAMRWWGRS